MDLPTATTARFLLLAGTATAATTSAYAFLAGQPSGDLLARCTRIATDDAGAADPGSWTSTYDRCTAATERDRGLVILAGLAVLVLVTALVTWLRPRWQQHRARLTPLRAADDPELAAALGDLVTRAGLTRSPTFMGGPYGTATGAHAYGRAPDYRVMLGPDVIARYYADRPVFRATVLRELAHIHHRDVLTADATTALWRAYLLVAVLPYAIALTRTEPPHLAGAIWRLVVLTGLVHLTARSVLRLRELHADAQARAWEGPGSALSRLVAQAGSPRHRPLAPSPHRRAAIIGNPALVHSPPRWVPAAVAFTAGLAASAAYRDAARVLLVLIPGIEPLTLRWVSAVLVAALVAATVGADILLRVRHHVPTMAATTGLALSAGLIAGPIVAAPGHPVTVAGLLLALGAAAWTSWVALDAELHRSWLPGLLVATFALGAALAAQHLTADLDPVARAGYTVLSSVAPTSPAWLYALVEHPVVLLITQRPEILLAAVLLTLRLLPLRLLGPILAGICGCVAGFVVHVVSSYWALLLVFAAAAVAGAFAAARVRAGAAWAGFTAGLCTGGIGSATLIGSAGVTRPAVCGAIIGLVAGLLVRAAQLLRHRPDLVRHRAPATTARVASTATIALSVLVTGLIARPRPPAIFASAAPAVTTACTRFRSLTESLGTVPASRAYAQLLDLTDAAAATDDATVRTAVDDLRRALSASDADLWTDAILRLDATCTAAGR